MAGPRHPRAGSQFGFLFPARHRRLQLLRVDSVVDAVVLLLVMSLCVAVSSGTTRLARGSLISQ
eukprot:scaffold647856_cov33-Prasinocladus_malaysianus.AAC.1